MHVATKDSSKDGKKHRLVSVLEADGASELCSLKAALEGKIVALERTVSGGISCEVEIEIHEPASEEQPERAD